MWVCGSMPPGIRYCPLPSRTSAPGRSLEVLTDGLDHAVGAIDIGAITFICG
jgi:hypothetical protein